MDVSRAPFWSIHSLQSVPRSNILQSNAYQKIGESSVHAKCVIFRIRGRRVPDNQNVDSKKRRTFCHCRPLTLRMIGPQMATRQTSDSSKLAIIPFRFRPCRFMEQLRASRHSEGSAAWAQPVNKLLTKYINSCIFRAGNSYIDSYKSISKQFRIDWDTSHNPRPDLNITK